MQQPHLFVAIEGLDGTGKSTAADRLATTLSANGVPAVSLHTPLEPFASLRDYISATNNVDTQFHFFLAAVHDASQKIAALLKETTVVCDRYLFSTVAYHRARGATMLAGAETFSVLQPDTTFYLTVDDEGVRRTRIDARQEHRPGDELLRTSGSLLERIDLEFRTFPSLIIVDTSRLTVDEVVKTMIARIGL